MSKEDVESYLNVVRSDVNMKAGRASFRYCDLARDLSTQRMSTRHGPGGSCPSRATDFVRAPKEAASSAGSALPTDQDEDVGADALSWRAGVTRQLNTLNRDMTNMSEQLSAVEDALSVLTQRSETPRSQPPDSSPGSRVGATFNDPMSLMRRAVGMDERASSSGLDA